MIDKVIKLQDGLEYYVLDVILENRKIYLFLIQVDNANNITYDKCVIAEAEFDESKIKLSNIKDSEVQEKINNMFIKRMHEKVS